MQAAATSFPSKGPGNEVEAADLQYLNSTSVGLNVAPVRDRSLFTGGRATTVVKK